MNNGNKTFIILAPGFPKDEADSTCLTFPQLFVKTLKKNNPEINILVFAFQYPFSIVEYQWYGVDVIPFNGRDKGKLSRLLIWRKVLKRLKSVLEEKQVIGFLNLWMGECALIGNYAAKKYGKRSFTWLMGQDAKQNNRYVLFIKPGTDNTIALSDFLADEFCRNYKIKPGHIIPPGIDPADFTFKPEKRTIDIIGAGSLIPLKRYDIFIRVIGRLVKKYPSLKAVICGEGPERENLLRLIEEYGLSANIELPGEIDHNNVLELMQRSKILLHPSAYEGFPTVYSEALYAGAHVVGFFSPMNTLFDHQWVVDNELSMINVADKILADNGADHSRVLTFSITETCSKILSLY